MSYLVKLGRSFFRLRFQICHSDIFECIFVLAELNISYRAVLLLFLYPHSIIELFPASFLRTKTYSILV